MSLPDMLKTLKLTVYGDYYMNIAAAVDLYISVQEYEFENPMVTIADYYGVDVQILMAYFNETSPFVDDSYIKLIEIIRARDNCVSPQDFCMNSSHWIGNENEAAEMFSKMKTLPPLLFQFEKPRDIWRTRSWRDLLLNLFD